MARAPKDAIVICLDIGPGMQQAPPGEDTPLEASVKIIQMMIQRKIFSESKDELAVVLFGTEDTLNNLDDGEGEGYQNISVLHPHCIPGFDLLESVANIKPGPEEADFLDAITVALDILHTETQGKKIEYRRLVLFTNFDHGFSDDSLEGIIRGFNCENEEVQLNVIAPTFEEPFQSGDNDKDDGSDGEGPSGKKPEVGDGETLCQKPKSPQQRAGEKLISRILGEGVDGHVYSYDRAVLALTGFEKKSTRSVAWKCELSLGNDLAIPCAAYVKTKASNLKKGWTKCHAKTGKAEDMMEQKYFVRQDDQQTEVDEDNISKGYKYGKDVIPFSKDDEEQMKYRTESKCLSILGFTELANVLVQDLMDDQAHYVIAEKDDKAAQEALAALITALHNQDMCAIARYVYRKGLNPKLVALLPKIRETYQCLVMVPLPYAEDIRTLDFPGLESKLTPAPSDEQLSAVDKLIDTMDLCASDSELFRPNEMVNPYFQWVYHNLSHRALNPCADMPALDARIKSILAPNQEITDRSKLAAEEVKKCFVLEKQEDKKKKASATETWGDLNLAKPKDEPGTSADGGSTSTEPSIAQIFSSRVVTTVGSVNPDQDFITLLKNIIDADSIARVFEQLQQRVFEFVIDTFNPGSNRKVIPCVQIMRQEASERQMGELFNSFLKKLKSMLLLDKSRRNYWEQMVALKISLIECDSVSREDAKDFLQKGIEYEQPGAATAMDEDVDDDTADLLDEL